MSGWEVDTRSRRRGAMRNASSTVKLSEMKSTKRDDPDDQQQGVRIGVECESR